MIKLENLLHMQFVGKDLLADHSAFHRIREKISSQDLPYGEPVNWHEMLFELTDLMQQHRPDFLASCYCAYAVARSGTATSISDSIFFLNTFLSRHWDTMDPPTARIKRRTNTLCWFIDRLTPIIDDAKIKDRKSLDAVQTQIDELDRICQQHFPSSRFDFSAIKELLSRSARSLHDNTECLNTKVPLDDASLATTSIPPTPTTPTSPVFTDASRLEETLPKAAREIGQDLCRLARQLAEKNDTDPQAYRLWRMGLWINVLEPPITVRGRTQIPPPPKSLFQAIQTHLDHQKYGDALILSERSMLQNRLAIDLQYYSYLCLELLGSSYSRARQEVEEQTSWLCRRIPNYIDQKFNDGSPIISACSQAWIRKLVSPKLQLMTTDDHKDFNVTFENSESKRYRFFLRSMRAAEKHLAKGHFTIAYAFFRKLDVLRRHHHLDQWEPNLALRSLSGLYRSMQSIPTLSDKIKASTLQKIALLSPKDALLLQPGE